MVSVFHVFFTLGRNLDKVQNGLICWVTGSNVIVIHKGGGANHMVVVPVGPRHQGEASVVNDRDPKIVLYSVV